MIKSDDNTGENSPEVFYQDAVTVWSWWRIDLMRATDGTGALWLTVRLWNGNTEDDED